MMKRTILGITVHGSSAVARRQRSANARTLILVGLLVAGSAVPSRAEFTAILQESGSNVVATGSGSLNVSNLTQIGSFTAAAQLQPSSNGFFIGPLSKITNVYSSGSNGPANFGTGSGQLADSGSGTFFGLAAFQGSLLLFIPADYISGSFIQASSTYNNASFASLGLTPGSYTYNFGSGANADAFKIQVGAGAVAAPGPIAGAGLVPLVGFAGGWLVRRRRKALAA